MKQSLRPRFALNAVFAATLACFAQHTAANPSDGTVVSGGATFVNKGNGLYITNTPGAIINWKSFSIGKDELTRFIQQSGDSAVLNRITGQDPSQILGQLQSNGHVFLINPNGIVFGQGAQIDTAGLVASTLNISDDDFRAGKMRFEGASTGTINNAANITTPTGGFVYLIAPSIENNGVIVSPKGEILLAAGASVELVDGVDTSLRVKLSATGGTTVNVGQLIANQGRIGIFAAAIQQQGLVSANRAELGEGGAVVFRASRSIDLAAGSVTQSQGGVVSIDTAQGDTTVEGKVDVSNGAGKAGVAQLLGKRVGLFNNAVVDASGRDGGGSVFVGGDFQGKNAAIHNADQTVLGKDAQIDVSAKALGDGGRLIVWADGLTTAQGNIFAKGGALGGHGGFVEVSGKQQLNFTSAVDASALLGAAGTLLLDPLNLEIVSVCGTGCDLSVSTVAFGDGNTTGTSTILNSTLSSSNSNISLQASNNIELAFGANISATHSIYLNAGNNISILAPVSSTSNVTLQATNQINLSNSVTSSGGDVTLSGSDINISANVSSTSGSVTMTASSGNVSITSGVISSGNPLDITAGGNITMGSTSSMTSPNNLVLSAGNQISLGGNVGSTGGTTILSGNSVGFVTGGTIVTGSGGWQVWSNSTSGNTTGLTYDFRQFNSTYGSTSVLGSGNGFFYRENPTLTLNGTVSKVYDGSTLVGSLSGLYLTSAASELINFTGGSAVFDDKNVGSRKLITVSSLSGMTDTSSKPIYYAGGASASNTIGDISQATLVINAIGNSKVYDGTTSATVTFSDNKFSGDSISYNLSSASFGDKNVGTNKSITFGGLTISGADIGNYNYTLPTSASGNITPATLVFTAADITKVYDATTAASVVLTDNRISGDNLIVTYGTSNFADKNVGNGKTINIGGISVTGADIGNYTFAASTTSKGNITPATLLISGVGQSKVYDTTTTAIVTLAGKTLGTDSVLLKYGAANFSDKNVGAGKSISVTGITVTGVDAANYVFSSNLLASADITPALLTITGVGVSRVYDATTGATVTLKDDRLVGDSLIIAYGSANFADKNVGDNKSILINGLTVSGADAANYTINSKIIATANITPATLLISALGQAKIYDAKTNALVTLSDNRIAGDSLTVNYSAANFGDKNVGNGKNISISGISLTGADARNYIFNTTANAAGDITPASLFVSATGTNRIYDTTTNATVTLADNRLAGDTLILTYGSASFADKNVGNGKNITVDGIKVSGADAQNYIINISPNATADITPASLVVTGLGVANKVYDASTQATLLGTPTIGGALKNDVVSLSGTLTANFIDKNVGDGKAVTLGGYALAGADARNYTLVAPGSMTANITPATLTLTGLATSAGKTYDGSDAATISNYGLLGGLFAGDKVSVSGSAKYADKNVGTGKAISITNLGLNGADAGNYLLATRSTTGVGDIFRLDAVAWIGGANGLWSDPKNWANGAIPDLQNVAAVILPAGASVIYDLSVGGVTRLDQIQGAGSIVMRDGQLVLAGATNLAGWQQSGGRLDTNTLSVTGNAQQSGGQLTVAGEAKVGSLNQTGGRIDANALTVSGKLQQVAGQIAVTTAAKFGGLAQTGGRIEARDLMASTGFQQTGGAIVLADGGTVTANQDVGALLVGDTTATNINLTSAGDVSSGIGSNLSLKGDNATITAGGAIGPLQTRLNRVALKASGNIGLTNSVALIVSKANSTGGNIRIESFGGLTTQKDKIVAKGKVDLITHSPMVIGEGGVSAGEGITLQSGTGTGNDDVTINGNLDATLGSCAVLAGGNVLQNANINLASNGSVSVQALTGSLKMSPTASTVSNGGAISYKAVGDVVLGVLDAGAAGQVSIGAINGTVLSAAPGLLNVRAGKLDVNAGGKIDLGADVPAGQLSLTSAIGYAVAHGQDGAVLLGSILPVSDSESQGSTVTGLSNVGAKIDQGGEVKDDTQQKIDERSNSTNGTTKDGSDDKRKKAKKC